MWKVYRRSKIKAWEIHVSWTLEIVHNHLSGAIREVFEGNCQIYLMQNPRSQPRIDWQEACLMWPEEQVSGIIRGLHLSNTYNWAIQESSKKLMVHSSRNQTGRSPRRVQEFTRSYSKHPRVFWTLLDSMWATQGLGMQLWHLNHISGIISPRNVMWKWRQLGYDYKIIRLDQVWNKQRNFFNYLIWCYLCVIVSKRMGGD